MPVLLEELSEHYVEDENLALKGQDILAQGNALGTRVNEVVAQAGGHSEY